GLKVPITATLYDRVTKLALAQVVFQPGSGTLVGGSRFLQLDKPITLLPGFQGVIAASGYGPQEPWAEVRPDGIVTAVNAGGAADGRYRKDTYSRGGSTFQNPAAIDTSHVLNPAPQAVYQSGRFGRNPDPNVKDFTYTFGALQPAEVRQGATYTVRLHFAEPYVTAPGQRLFDVAINGTTVLKDFDIFAAAGAIDTAVVRGFNIVPDADGKIVIHFLPGSADLPMVNGIELLRPGVENAPWKTNGDVGALTFVGGGLFGLPSEYPASDGGNSMPNPYAAGTFQYREPAWEQTKNTPKTYAVTIDGSGFDVQEKKDFAALPPAFIAGTITGHPLQPNGQVQPNAVPQPGTTVQLLNAAFVTGVNAGGDASRRYLADTGFSGGSTFPAPDALDTSHVFDPAPQAVYQTGRFGKSADGSPSPFTYTIPGLKAEASYTVRLHFAEPYFVAPGQRLFGVAINGTTVLTDFDIFATAGAANTAVTQEFKIVPKADGKIVIDFTLGSPDLPMVNGIEILQLGVTTVPWKTNDDVGALTFVGGGALGNPSDYPDTPDEHSMPNPYAAGTFPYREPAWEQTKDTPKTYSVTIDGSGFDLQEKKDFAALPPAFIAGTITGHPLQNGKVQPNAVPQPGTTVQLLNAAFVLGVNAGGTASGRYETDTGFSPSGVFRTQAAIDTSRVFDPAPQAVYQTCRVFPDF